VTRHPETREEGEGKLEDEGCNMGRESQKGDASVENKMTEIEYLSPEDEVVENIVEHPLQDQIHSSAGTVAEQLKAHHLAERGIEEVDDLGQGAFCPGFYVFQG
jgi:hypothetical protein